jgi:hypothetical protein
LATEVGNEVEWPARGNHDVMTGICRGLHGGNVAFGDVASGCEQGAVEIESDQLGGHGVTVPIVPMQHLGLPDAAAPTATLING